MHPFRTAVEAGDIAAAAELLADDVVFNSPAVFKPYAGKPVVGAILRAAFDTFEDFRYENELTSADGRDHALVFRARVGDREVQGADFIHTDASGQVTQFTVMVRPLSGLQALAAAMGERLAAAQLSG
jgi:hypothetical protein